MFSRESMRNRGLTPCMNKSAGSRRERTAAFAAAAHPRALKVRGSPVPRSNIQPCVTD